MTKYAIWQSHEEQWDANDLDPPRAIIEASNPQVAAEIFAEQQLLGDNEAALVIRDESSGSYFEIELIKRWDIDLFKPTTLNDLCAP